MSLFRSVVAAIARAVPGGEGSTSPASDASGSAPPAVADAESRGRPKGADDARLVHRLRDADARAGNPRSTADLTRRAAVLRRWGRIVEASRAIDRASLADARDRDVMAEAAAIRLRQGRFADADSIYRELDEDYRGQPDRALERASARFMAGDTEAAVGMLADLASGADSDPVVLLALGEFEFARGAFEKAEAWNRQVLVRHPDHPVALANLAVACAQQDRNEEARDCLSRAIALDGDSGTLREARANLGIAEFNLGRVEDARRLLEATLPRHPDLSGLLQLGPAQLALGHFRSGWRNYEFRWQVEPLASIRADLGIPQWRGQPLDGAVVLVRAEQGIGDIFQFVRYLPMLKARGATVHFQPLRGMESVARRFPGVDRVVVEGERLADLDYYVNLLSLPLAFGTTLETVPAECPYLTPSESFARKWAQRFDGTSFPRVGIAWAGRPEHRRDRHRSLRIEQLEPILRVPGVRFVALQKGPAAVTAPPDVPGLEWEDLGRESNELDDALAILDRLDLLVCVDTALAHMAGALGKPAWVLIADPPDFRWMLDREDTPWYPTLRLFRQSAPGNWEPAIAKVAEAMDRWRREARDTREVAARSVTSAPSPDVDRPPPGLPFAAETRARFIEFVPDDGDRGQSIEYCGQWRQAALDGLASLLRSGDEVLMAGTGSGVNALQLANALAPSGHVIACEPGPVHRRLLERNVSTHRVSNLTVLATPLTGSAAESGLPQDASVDELGLERLAALYVEASSDPIAVLDGAESTLWRDRPVLAIVADDPATTPNLVRRMADLGYRCLALDQSVFEQPNFNRRQDDVFAGRRYQVIFGVAEEQGRDENFLAGLKPLW